MALGLRSCTIVTASVLCVESVHDRLGPSPFWDAHPKGPTTPIAENASKACKAFTHGFHRVEPNVVALAAGLPPLDAPSTSAESS